MDLQYLLWLQSLREAAGPVIEALFAGISTVSIVISMVLPVLIYWCVNPDEGLFLLTNFSCGTFVNNSIKVSVCAYRPWIRDPSIRPSRLAVSGATGYSFPSGHTQTAATTWGAYGWLERKKKKSVTAFCWILTLLVAFSRNFLGVHTPQDVIAALLESVAILAVLLRLVPWISSHPEKDVGILVIGLAAVGAMLAYYEFKPYPMDYVNGQLLVDPLEMQKDAFGGAGVFAGLLTGWFLEHRYVKHEAARGKKYWLAGIGAVILVFAAYELLAEPFITDGRWANFVLYGLMIFSAVYLAPLCMKKADEHQKNKKA